MIGQTISHYKTLKKLGEVPIRLDLAIPTCREKLSPIVGLSIPPILSLSKDGGSGKGRYL
ncbi:MAG: hypothetical protein HY800_08930 [Ignavibacteriales bacterium]|nr:hypothetical protein [Ignavibacteriales bacterium]